MAYPKIDQMLSDEGQKANIFAPSQVTGGEPGIPTDSVQKSGDTVGTGGQGQQQSQDMAQSVQDTAENRGSREVIRRNIGKQQAPKLLENLSGQIAQTQKGLQDQADSFVSGIRDADYSVNTDTLDKAYKEGQASESFQDVSTRFATPFQLGEDQTFNVTPEDYSIKPVQDLQAALADSSTDRTGTSALDSWATNTLRQEAGPQYTSGEAALDLALLKATPDYQQRLANLAGEQTALTQFGQGLGGATQQRAQTAGTESYDAATQAAQDYLQDAKLDMISGFNADALAENQLRTDLRAANESHLPGVDTTKATFGTDRTLPGFADEYLAGMDLSDYYGGYVPYTQLIDATEASQFNALQALLGSDWQLSEDLRGETGRFDQDRFIEDLTAGAQGLETAYNTEQQDIIDRILGTAEQGQRDALSVNAADTIGGLQTNANRVRDAIAEEMGISIADSSPELFGGAPAIEEYFDPTAISATSYLSPEDFDALTTAMYNREIGTPEAQQDLFEGFNVPAYEAAIRSFLGTQQDNYTDHLKSNVEGPSAAPMPGIAQVVTDAGGIPPAVLPPAGELDPEAVKQLEQATMIGGSPYGAVITSELDLPPENPSEVKPTTPTYTQAEIDEILWGETPEGQHMPLAPEEKMEEPEYMKDQVVEEEEEQAPPPSAGILPWWEMIP